MDVISAIFAVFDAVMSWLVGAIAKAIPIFWVAETGLTFMGSLALVALGISVVFLLIGIVQRFLKLGA